MTTKNDSTKQPDSLSQDAFANVLNIPKKIKITDLRSFFSDFIERERFQIFHYLRSPETSENKTLETHKCLVQLKTLRDLNDFIARYNNKLWIDKNGQKLDSMCVIEKANAPLINIDKEIAQSEPEAEQASASTKFLSIKERRALLDKKKKAATNNPINLELVAPAGLPQGNVGTSRREIKRAIDRCTLPTSVLKGLGIQQKALSDKLFGAVPLKYSELNSPRERPTVDYVDQPPEYYQEINKGKKSRKRRRGEIEDNYIERDSEDSSGEEWDRYQAIHEDDNDEGYLYEEKVDKPWDKGGSGLVTYTDAVHWDSLKGDDDERDVDDWDMKLSAKKDRQEHRSTTVLRRPRKQFKFTPRANTNNIPSYQSTSGINVETTSVPSSNVGTIETDSSLVPQSDVPAARGDIGAFEKHTKGTASKIMTKMGWRSGQGIGAKGREGISEPIQLDANLATYGLGYKPIQVPKRAHQNQQPFIPTIYDSNYYTPNYVSNPARDTVSFRSVNGVKQKLISFSQGEVIDANGTIVNKKRGPDEFGSDTNEVDALVAYEDVED
eukprot:TRINITY_DN4385_c0_g1_i1.p1 TRINITY_DN4385_c0_g1~~TRINITY_DN4385_c0_g1_i1.p1  ORF type:complete len:553 (-),score=97.62 TRINITY_DN4385_c0_g1_i1:132-1790(-)